MAETVAVWQGDLLWPQDSLADAPIIDLSQVDALGSWAHGWLRSRGQRKIIGASPRLRTQLTAAGLPLLWYQTLSDASVAGEGVSASERAMLWS